MATFFSAPAPLLQVGHLPMPRIVDLDEFEDVAHLQPGELEDFCLRALSATHTVSMLVTLAGYEVLELYILEISDNAPRGQMGIVDLQTQEIHVRDNPWVPMEGFQVIDGIMVGIELRANSGLPGGPIPLATLSRETEAGTIFLGDHLTEDATQAWPQRLEDLLQTLSSGFADLEQTLRAELESAIPSENLASWLRSERSGLLAIYDYTSWDHSALNEKRESGYRAMQEVGERVWQHVTQSRQEFLEFLEKQTARVESVAGEEDRNLFPTLPARSAWDEMLAISDSTKIAQLLQRHGISTWPDLTQAMLEDSDPHRGLMSDDLRLLNYTELLMLMHESKAVDILAFIAGLSGEELRQQVEQRLAEAKELAEDVLEQVHLWQRDNHTDLAVSLAGDLPANMKDGQIENLLANVAGTSFSLLPQVGEFVAVLGTSAATATATGAAVGTAVSPVVGTLVGAAAGFIVATAAGSFTARRSAWASQLSAVAISARVQALIDAFNQVADEAFETAQQYLDDLVTTIELMLADPSIPDSELQRISDELLADLETFREVPEGFGDNRSLADSLLYLWVVERGWGFLEPAGGWQDYEPEGGWQLGLEATLSWVPSGYLHSATNRAVYAYNRHRVLQWSKWSTPDLFIAQCEYEWRSLGVDVEATIAAAMRADPKASPEDYLAAYNGREYRFENFDLPPPIAPPEGVDEADLPAGVVFTWEDKRRGYGLGLPWTVTSPADPVQGLAGATNLTQVGIEAIAAGNFILRCILELEVRLGSCRIKRLHYRFEFADPSHATILVEQPAEEGDFLVSFEPQPNDYYEHDIEPVTPSE